MRRKLHTFLEAEELEEPVLNLTPLIDVVFVLLITFLLISPFVSVDHVELAPSGVLHQTDVSSSPLTITVKANDSIWFQGEAVTFADLKKKMQIEKQRKGDAVPQLIADKHSHFGFYQEVKNVLEECGFERMDVILQ